MGAGGKRTDAEDSGLCSATEGNRATCRGTAGREDRFPLRHQVSRRRRVRAEARAAKEPAGARRDSGARSMSDKERVVLDPTVLDPSGRTTIDFYTPSYDGKYVALSLSKDGSEAGRPMSYEVATGKRLPDTVPRVMYPTAGGSIEWAGGQQGLLLHAVSERQTSGRRRIGTSFRPCGSTTRQAHRGRWYVIGREFPRIAEIELRRKQGWARRARAGEKRRRRRDRLLPQAVARALGAGRRLHRWRQADELSDRTAISTRVRSRTRHWAAFWRSRWPTRAWSARVSSCRNPRCPPTVCGRTFPSLCSVPRRRAITGEDVRPARYAARSSAGRAACRTRRSAPFSMATMCSCG